MHKKGNLEFRTLLKAKYDCVLPRPFKLEAGIIDRRKRFVQGVADNYEGDRNNSFLEVRAKVGSLEILVSC